MCVLLEDSIMRLLFTVSAAGFRCLHIRYFTSNLVNRSVGELCAVLSPFHFLGLHLSYNSRTEIVYVFLTAFFLATWPTHHNFMLSSTIRRLRHLYILRKFSRYAIGLF
jgi:hypothetical protein